PLPHGSDRHTAPASRFRSRSSGRRRPAPRPEGRVPVLRFSGPFPLPVEQRADAPSRACTAGIPPALSRKSRTSGRVEFSPWHRPRSHTGSSRTPKLYRESDFSDRRREPVLSRLFRLPHLLRPKPPQRGLSAARILRKPPRSHDSTQTARTIAHRRAL